MFLCMDIEVSYMDESENGIFVQELHIELSSQLNYH